MSSPFKAGKLLDFFRYFDPKDPQQVEAVRRLERSLLDKAPELLTDEAYWVQAWRKPTPPAPARPKLVSVNIRDRVKILAQSNSISCGQTACAMAINTLTGRKWTDRDFDRNHGFNLLGGLQAECPGHVWKDAGNLTPASWPAMLESLAASCPVVAAANGPTFSPSGHGHIMLIMGVTPRTVIFADPNGGILREVARSEWEQAPSHPDGNFVFLAVPK